MVHLQIDACVEEIRTKIRENQKELSIVHVHEHASIYPLVHRTAASSSNDPALFVVLSGNPSQSRRLIMYIYA